MFALIIEAMLVLAAIALELLVFGAFLFVTEITVVNSILLGVASGLISYQWNRGFDAFFSFQIHPAICLVIGIAVFILMRKIQETLVGFWICAILFSIIWALILSSIVYMFFKIDMVWYWVIFGLSLIANIKIHYNHKPYY